MCHCWCDFLGNLGHNVEDFIPLNCLHPFSGRPHFQCYNPNPMMCFWQSVMVTLICPLYTILYLSKLFHFCFWILEFFFFFFDFWNGMSLSGKIKAHLTHEKPESLRSKMKPKLLSPRSSGKLLCFRNHTQVLWHLFSDSFYKPVARMSCTVLKKLFSKALFG